MHFRAGTCIAVQAFHFPAAGWFHFFAVVIRSESFSISRSRWAHLDYFSQSVSCEYNQELVTRHTGGQRTGSCPDGVRHQGARRDRRRAEAAAWRPQWLRQRARQAEAHEGQVPGLHADHKTRRTNYALRVEKLRSLSPSSNKILTRWTIPFGTSTLNPRRWPHLLWASRLVIGCRFDWTWSHEEPSSRVCVWACP